MESNPAIILSVAFFLCIYLRSWFGTYKTSIEACVSAATCDIRMIATSLFMSFFIACTSLLTAMLVMWLVECFVVDVLKMPKDRTNDLISVESLKGVFKMPVSFAIIINWMTDWRVLVSIALSLVATAAFSIILSQAVNIYIKQTGATDASVGKLLKRCMSIIYVFGLVSMIVFVVYQLHITSAKYFDAEWDPVVINSSQLF